MDFNTPSIHFVNHASFIYDDGLVRILSDPWLHGLAFDDGWSLLSETRLGPEDFRAITHIWISHEHPDHFSPSSLASIPPEYAQNITFLFQETRDKKVVNYCKNKLRFKEVIELQAERWYPLSERTKICCIPCPADTCPDSLLCFKGTNVTLLNTNDCFIPSDRTLEAFKKHFGPIDLLLTQFSYAGWAGNAEDRAYRRKVADENLDRLVRYTNVFNPKYTLPFASFVWFCNEENHHMNDESVRVNRAVEAICSRTPSTPLVLYPGETWSINQPHDNSGALARYQEDYRTADSRIPLVKNSRYSEADLQSLCQTFLAKLKEHNNAFLLRLLPSAYVYVNDLGAAYRLSPHGLVKAEVDRARCDVLLGSEGLAYAFKFLWGGDTLNINGRFAKGKTFWHFRIYFAVAALNNSDDAFTFRYLFKNFGIAFRKLGSYLSGA